MTPLLKIKSALSTILAAIALLPLSAQAQDSTPPSAPSATPGISNRLDNLSGEGTTALAIGYNILKDELIFDLLFNRTTSEEAKSQFDIKIVKDAFVFNPAAEIHLGGGTNSSPDNIILLTNFYYKNVLPKADGNKWTWYYKVNILSPELTSDKNFSVYQGYLTLGGSLTPSYKMRSGWGDLEFRIAAYYNQGMSKLDEVSLTESISRFKLDPSVRWSFIGTKSSVPPELNPDFYYKLSIISYLTHYYFLQQDERIIDKKSLGFFNVDVGYRFAKPLKIALGYKAGRLEPLYKKVESLNVGLTFIY